MSDCVKCVKDTIAAFGGLDIIVANAGWTRFSDFNDLASMSDDEWTKCWMTNVMGPKKFVETAMPTFNSNSEGGVVIITSSIAAQRLAGSSMPYSVTKAAQVHMMKCVAISQGPKLRINAVLPGLLLTDWGNLYGEERIKMLTDASALKKEVSLRSLQDLGKSANGDFVKTIISDCADMYISLAQNTSVTGQAFTVGEYHKYSARDYADLKPRFRS